MKIQNAYVTYDEDRYSTWVYVDCPNAWNVTFCKDLAFARGACSATAGKGTVSAHFYDDEHAQNFAAEVVAYTDQQAWFESIDEDEAKQYALVL